MKNFSRILMAGAALAVLAGCATKRLPSEDLEVPILYPEEIAILKNPNIPSNSEEKYNAIKRLIKKVDFTFTREAKTINDLLYFGDGNYAKCMEHLSGIIAVKDPQVRRDLQCYARMLNLVASYEAGIDHTLDYQIRSVFTFIVKMKDMTDMKRELFAFFRKLNNLATLELKKEFQVLYERLKPYENHPYERRTFYYFDLISWLKSKITGRNFGDIVRERFDELVAGERKRAAASSRS